MANQWFRMYSEFASDPKVQMMSEVLQRRLVMLFCMQCGNVIETFHETERDSAIAFHLRISESDWMETKAHFIAKGFVNDDCEILNWDKRQFESDSSTARVKAYRERKKAEQKNTETDVKRFSNGLEQNRTEQNRTDTESLGASASDTPSDDPDQLAGDAEAQAQNSQPEKPKSPKPDYPDWFEQLWQAYPPRQGSNDKRRALHAARARIKSGSTHDQLISAVGRYARYLQANGNWGTQYVMQASTFLGPGGHIENPWSFNHATSQSTSRIGGSPAKVPHAELVHGQAQRAFERLHGGGSAGPVRQDGRVISEQGQV